jgi:penicillin-binding protein 1C
LALAKAAANRILGHGERGASTITMQLAELIENPSGKAHARRRLAQKIAQIGKAIVLELSWKKRDILEAYMNLITYRGELQGISAASYGLFDKSPVALTRPEATVIAALIRSPNANVKRVHDRACWLLTSLGAPDDCALLTEQHLGYIEEGYRIRPYMKMAPHVAKRLSGMPEVLQNSLVRSTLDRQIQWVALHALQKQITAEQSQNMNDGAVIVIENATGNVLAYVGNVGAVSKAPYVDAVIARRQAGSTLKPLMYAKAIDERILTAATVLEDSPLAISVTTGLYRPSNFDRAFRNLVTVRTALASSLNIPAVRTLELLGVDSFVQTMAELGFTGLERPDFYGPSLALGSADVRLLELANAYRTLANGGEWSPLRFSPDQLSDQARHRVYSPEAAFIIDDILSDREARVATFGLESTLSTRFWTAVKTGTSKDMRDNWTVGFSNKYTVGVWCGNFSGAAMWNVTGVQGAAPVWQEVMNYLHRTETSRAPVPPPGLVRRHVTFAHNKESRDEWFITGTEPNLGTIDAKPEVRSHISYPMDQSLIAMDPDIPRENHRLFIQIVAPKADQNIYLNGQRLGRAKDYLAWEPHAGKYTLELRNSQGLIVDRVHFEVRGRIFASK